MKTKKKIFMAGRYFMLAVGLVITLSAYASQSSGMTLDEAIAKAAAQMNERLPARTKVALISVSSPSEAFSGYVLEGLEAALLESGKLVVVDRTNIDKVRATYDGFQLSGEVNDASAKLIGQMVGAGAIVTGSLTNIGTLYRLTLKAIDVEKAVVAVSSSADITNDERVRALLGQSGSATLPAPQSGGSGAAQVPVSPVVQTTPDTPPIETALPDKMNLLDALDWISQNAQNGENYTIALHRNEAITPTELGYGGKSVAITLKSDGGQRTVTFEGNSPSYSLFTVKSGVTLTLEDGVTLRGTQNSAAKSLVEVAGGRFVLNGGVLTGNKTSGSGGGVYVKSGIFTMNKGSISKNTASESSWNGGNGGGGVYVESGTFIMNDGDISDNTASASGNGRGGGVNVKSGTFNMAGGYITGNTASGNGRGMGTWGGGGGVYINGTFNMTGGTISGNTTHGQGGGVHSNKFTMSGGTISGNTATGDGGGGVYVHSDGFTMTGGTISGNTTTNGYGGGVYVLTLYKNSFIKSGTGNAVIYGSNAEYEQANRARDDDRGHAVYFGGLHGGANGKKRNTTARTATAMDSTKDGPAGGWE